MPELVITIIFFTICFGQIWALTRGRLTAVLYYICVATLSYFSFWMFVTWEPDRVCGALLVIGGFLLYRRPKGIPGRSRRSFFFFFAYVVGLTLVSSFFWPIEAMSGRSAAYGPLRVFVQIFNWAVIAGVAWQISLALRENNQFDKARRWFIALGMFHSAVALYQVVAFWTGLPLTGIRRVAVGVGLNFNDPHLAIATIGDLALYRATSFVGEPRSLAAASMLWIAGLFTLYAEGRSNGRTHLAMLLSLLVLGMTLSTSGWGGFFLCLTLAGYLASTQRKWRLGGFFALSLFMGLLLAVDSVGWMPEQLSLKTVFEERWTGRIGQSLSDLPVEETLNVLSTHPLFAVFGAGAGGMSFYIAQNLGGYDMILASTVGIVNLIGDLGFVGLFIMLIAIRGGIRNLLFHRSAQDDLCRRLSFMGCVFLCQSLIYAPSYILSASIGFLLASQFRSQAIDAYHIFINKTPQAIVAETSRAHSY